ncbi:sugar transferase [Streptococcus sp. E24BD]|uniref:sugar transferase n=1 Tax=Streptococcus sp. E24BD TaxID=3278715 RepID=UPI00359D8F33
MKIDNRTIGLYEKYFKRLLDILLSASALIILSPVMLLVVILVRVKLGSPVIFKQQRPGKDEKIFSMYKFRTMTDEKDSEGNLLPDGIRLTPFGKLLRSTSLDELPELWNILKGDMSIIGPRPLLTSYLRLYNNEQRKRHAVRPGLTGLAQVNGRNSLSWEEKFALDIRYINNIYFLKDVEIFLKTIKSVIKRDGISSNNSATIEEFKGNQNV